MVAWVVFTERSRGRGVILSQMMYPCSQLCVTGVVTIRRLCWCRRLVQYIYYLFKQHDRLNGISTMSSSVSSVSIPFRIVFLIHTVGHEAVSWSCNESMAIKRSIRMIQWTELSVCFTLTSPCLFTTISASCLYSTFPPILFLVLSPFFSFLLLTSHSLVTSRQYPAHPTISIHLILLLTSQKIIYFASDDG